jgi:hypothetical protein
MTITPNTHLPNDAYWVSNSSYNGLSQLAKFGTTQRIDSSMIKPLRARSGAAKISKTIVKQLNVIAYLMDDTRD